MLVQSPERLSDEDAGRGAGRDADLLSRHLAFLPARPAAQGDPGPKADKKRMALEAFNKQRPC